MLFDLFLTLCLSTNEIGVRYMPFQDVWIVALMTAWAFMIPQM